MRGYNVFATSHSPIKFYTLREPITSTKLTVVFLHVGPKVSFFHTVSKCAVPNVLTLLASCHMHANLNRDQKTFGLHYSKSEYIICLANIRWEDCAGNIPQIEMEWVFWLEAVLQLSTFSFHGNLQAPPACLLPTWDRKTAWLNNDIMDCSPPHTQRHPNTYVCLALAVQYFLFLSASLSWPFLQHWPQTNIIFRFGGPNLLSALGSCWLYFEGLVKICD